MITLNDYPNYLPSISSQAKSASSYIYALFSSTDVRLFVIQKDIRKS